MEYSRSEQYIVPEATNTLGLFLNVLSVMHDSRYRNDVQAGRTAAFIYYNGWATNRPNEHWADYVYSNTYIYTYGVFEWIDEMLAAQWI